VGGASQLALRKDGFLIGNSAFTIIDSTSTGRLRLAAGDVRIYANASVANLQVTTTKLGVPSATAFGWTGTTDASSALDTVLTRDAANTLAQRNGTNAQAFRVYNTFTDNSNYERGEIRWVSNVFQLVANQAGTGTARAMNVGTVGAAGLRLVTTDTIRWEVNSTGHFVAGIDNSYDIGTSGAIRPRTGYFGTSVVAPQLRTTGFTVGTLPACNAGNIGARSHVTDATAPAFLTALVGGGAVVSPAFCDGTNWVAG
jgi:hypothetical protein